MLTPLGSVVVVVVEQSSTTSTSRKFLQLPLSTSQKPPAAPGFNLNLVINFGGTYSSGSVNVWPCFNYNRLHRDLPRAFEPLSYPHPNMAVHSSIPTGRLISPLRDRKYWPRVFQKDEREHKANGDASEMCSLPSDRGAEVAK